MKTSLIPVALLGLSLGLPAQESQPAEKQGTDQKVEKTQEKTPKKTVKAYKVPFTVGAEVDPKIELPALDGKKHKLGDLRGKVVFIHFYSTTCPYEKWAMPKINQIAADYAKKGVVVIGIAANGREIGAKPDPDAFKAKKSADRPYANVRKKAEEEKVNHDILVDHGSVVAAKFRARTTPHSFVIDAKGIVRYDGALDNDGRSQLEDDKRQDYVRMAIEASLKGTKPEVDKTRPYG